MVRRTQDTGNVSWVFVYRILTFSDWPSHAIRLTRLNHRSQSYNPKEQALWFGLFPFRSPLLRKSIFLSLPTGTEMFQFPASTSNKLFIHLKVIIDQDDGVPPFGNLRIKAYLQLPEAYRCSSRPSSAPSAKAFTVRPYSLNRWLSCMMCEKFN